MTDNLSNNKRIAKNTLYLYLRMFLTLVVSLYTVRVVLKVLSVTDYGIYGAVGGVVASFSFISSTLACASQRYFSYEIGKGESGRVRDVFSTLFILYIIAAILITILAEGFGMWFLQNRMIIPTGREAASIWVFQFALASFTISLIANPFQAMIIAKERMTLYAYISIMDVLLKLSIVYLLSVVDFDKLKVYAVLLFFSSVISNSIYIIYCYRSYLETHVVYKIDFTLVKSIIGYSTWTLLGTIAGMCNSQGLNIILNLFFGPVANAAYAIANQVSTQSSLFANNFFTAIRPAIIKSYSSGDYMTVNKYCLFSSKCIFILMSIIVLPLLINTKELLTLWLGQIAPYMVSFVRLSLIYAILLAISNPITTVVQAQGNVKLYHGLVDGFALITLPITYSCFKSGLDASWGYISMIIIFSISHALRIYVLKRVFPRFKIQTYFFHFLLPVIAVFGLSFFIMIYIKVFFSSTLMGICVNSMLAVIIIFILSFSIVISSQERDTIMKLVFKKSVYRN